MSNTHQFLRHTALALPAFGLILGLLSGFAAPCLGQAAPHIPQLPELTWEKRSDWLDVTRDITPCAVGDGVADDTEALQAAFDEVRSAGSPFSTVYFPPGTYRITKEIYPEKPESPLYVPVHIRGHGRASRIVWDGAEGGRMFRIYGASFSTYIGIVWDGRGKAAEGFVHAGGGESKVTHQHVAFMNFTDFGCGAVERYLESSEWRNCLFINCGKGLWISSGKNAGHFIWTVDGCEFHDNGYGLSSDAGNFYARNCHFERSGQVDISVSVSHPANSVRRCTSIDSRAFIQFGNSPTTRSDLPLTIQDCHVSGWTNPDWAVRKNWSGPLLIFDCVFTDAPSASPPVSLGVPLPVVHSNNQTSTAQLFGGETQYLQQEVQRGQRGGSINSAWQRFFRDEAKIPTRVFDAKRDFGAAGNGQKDDTDAVQACIDAARQHGNGAIAYLPLGRYRVSSTINITGGDYHVGGAGVQYTRIDWGGGSAGPVFLVSDPLNVRMEYLEVRAGSLRPAVRQVSTTQQPSRMHYEHVAIIGDGLVLPNTFTGKGVFEAVGLSKDSVLTAFTFNVKLDGMSFENCSGAQILLGHVGNHSQGVLRVKGTQGDRSGFFGVQTGHTRYRIEDNQSFVASDTYIEQMGLRDWSQGPYVYLAGSPSLPEGRVTMSSPKIGGMAVNTAGEQDNPTYETFYTVDNYRGRLSVVASAYFNTGKETPPKSEFRYVCSGTAPLDILLMANTYQRVQPSVEGGANVTSNLYGNWLGALGTQSSPIPDTLSPNGMQLAAQALDDFREVGELDLQLNHPGVRDAGHSTRRAGQGVWPTRSATSAATENR